MTVTKILMDSFLVIVKSPFHGLLSVKGVFTCHTEMSMFAPTDGLTEASISF